MGVYSPYEVYPSDIDEIDLSKCDNCEFPCDEYDYCPYEKD